MLSELEKLGASKLVNKGDSLLACDIIRHSDYYEFQFNVVGIKKENVKVSIKDKMMIIEVNDTKESSSEERPDIIYNERTKTVTNATRMIALPADPEDGDMDATIEDGLLKIKLKRTKQAERNIEIK